MAHKHQEKMKFSWKGRMRTESSESLLIRRFWGNPVAHLLLGHDLHMARFGFQLRCLGKGDGYVLM
eukprot:592347-Amphidinium_carterae.1